MTSLLTAIAPTAKKLISDEEGTSFIEFSLVMGLVFAAGASVLYVGARQFMDAFLAPAAYAR